jgi:Zn-dependent protease with chaperone function
MAISAFRFDGRHADAQGVQLRVEGRALVVETAQGIVLDREPLDHVTVSEPLDRAPRLIGLSNHVTLEIYDTDGSLASALERAGVRPPLAVRLQRRWLAVLAILAALVGVLALGYFKGLPVAARWAAFAVPPRLEHRMGEQVLGVLDKHHVRASRLDTVRRTQIADRFARAAAAAAPGVAYRLEFRAGSKDEINALTLPGGIIVMLDGLVDVAEDDEVLAVLGHELGHVVAKHSTRQLFQSIGVGTLAGLLWGDFSGVAASVPVVIGLLHYSRDFEREADDFAVTVLKTQNLSADPLYDFFVLIADRARERHGGDVPVFLSSHPPTAERLQRLEQARR